RLAEQRRRHVRLADDDAGGPDLGAVVHHLEREVRQVDHDVSLAEVARIPAPALHIGDDEVDRLVARRTVELLDRLGVEVAGGRQLCPASASLASYLRSSAAPASPSFSRRSGTRGSSIGALALSLSGAPSAICLPVVPLPRSCASSALSRW